MAQRSENNIFCVRGTRESLFATCHLRKLVENTAAMKSKKPATAVYALILANFLAFGADKVFRLPLMRSLYLYHHHVQWWQPITSLFMHANRQHISGNMFLLLLFGRSVEDELGWPGLLFAFCFCGAVANLLSLLLLPTATVRHLMLFLQFSPSLQIAVCLNSLHALHVARCGRPYPGLR